jgi:zinc D-Ala-D-Ala carboxypeptidase
MNLSKNLTLFEMTRSDMAKRKGVSNEPTPEHIANMIVLAEKIFQPIREHFGVPIYISSGYRSAALNKKIGGVKNSQHLTGEAMDIDMDGHPHISNVQVFNYIRENLVFDQLIWEYGNNSNPDWIHVSYSTSGTNRRQVLKATKGTFGTKYVSM